MKKYREVLRKYRQAVARTANAYSSAWPIEKCRGYKAEETAAETALDDAVDELVKTRTKTDGTRLPRGVTKGELPPLTWDY